ncbi:MAG: serine/threonine-protein kinase [Nannocystaceae bacterium]
MSQASSHFTQVSTRSRNATAVGNVVAERYKINAWIADGCFGSLFRASDQRDDAQVALRLLPPAGLADREVPPAMQSASARILAVKHPNLMPVLAWEAATRSLACVATPFVDSSTWALQSGSGITLDAALDAGAQIASALAHLHRHGIVHLDLRPENVFYQTNAGEEPRYVVADFGLVSLLWEWGARYDASATGAAVEMGDATYLSPEQASGEPGDERSDMYALGVLLYEALSGDPPFRALDRATLLSMHLHHVPPPLPEAVPEIVTQLVHELLDKHPAKRPRDASAVRDVLRRARASVPVASKGRPAAPPRPQPRVSVNPPLKTRLADGLPVTLNPAVVRRFKSALRRAVALLYHREPATRTQPPPPADPPQRKRVPAYAVVGGSIALGLGIFTTGVVSLMQRDGQGDAPTDRQTDAQADRQPQASSAPHDAARGHNDRRTTETAPPSATMPVVEHHAQPARAVDSGTQEERHLAVDEMLRRGDTKGALARLRVLRDADPRSAELIWREGRALAATTSTQRLALARFGEALALQPKLIDNPPVRVTLDRLLRKPSLRHHAIDTAIRHMGVKGHGFLIELINEPKRSRSLGYNQRHRVLRVLRLEPASSSRIDRKLSLIRDLHEFGQAGRPCAALSRALDGIKEMPEAVFEDPLRTLKLRRLSGNTDEEAKLCVRLPAKVLAVRSAVAAANIAVPD